MKRTTSLLATGFAAVTALTLLSGGAPSADDCCAPSAGRSAVLILADQPTTRPAKKPAYPLDTCPVMNVALDSKGKPVEIKVGGRDVKVCCQRCARTFQQDAEKWNVKLDELIVAKMKDGYPLETCVVTGEKLGSMGEPINYVHREQNRLVRFCCEGCVAAFKKEPAKYLAKLDEAAKAGEEAGA